MESLRKQQNDFDVFKGAPGHNNADSDVDSDELNHAYSAQESDDLDCRADREIHDDQWSVASSSAACESLTDAASVLGDVEPYDFDKLPAHHCAYCGVHSPQTVVKCLHKDCNKWFCNGNSTNPHSSSHIIMHLVKSKHKEIALHPDSDLRDANLECHACKSTNIFLLGFMPAKTEAVVILLCREPCLR